MERVRRSVILIHGTWHDETCWHPVADLLADAGVSASVVTLPSADPLAGIRPGPGRAGRPLPTFADDVAAVRSAIDDAYGDEVLLCAHSYGGMVISEAGNHERVTRLLFLAGFCPGPGESAFDVVGRSVGPAPYRRRHDAAGLSVVSPRTASWFLYHDLPRQLRSRRAVAVVPTTAAVLSATVRRPAWRTTPTTYVRLRRDRVLGGRRQHELAYRVARAQLALNWTGEHLLTIDAGHCPFFSDPLAVADVIEAASVDRDVH